LNHAVRSRRNRRLVSEFYFEDAMYRSSMRRPNAIVAV
jgi:hypothetical protein